MFLLASKIKFMIGMLLNVVQGCAQLGPKKLTKTCKRSQTGFITIPL